MKTQIEQVREALELIRNECGEEMLSADDGGLASSYPAIRTAANTALTALKSLEGQEDYAGWYCAHCETGVDGSCVTFHEQHDACGRVITNDRPPKPSTPRLTVDEAMEVVRKWYNELSIIDLNGVSIPDDLRARLTKAAKP